MASLPPHSTGAPSQRTLSSSPGGSTSATADNLTQTSIPPQPEPYPHQAQERLPQPSKDEQHHPSSPSSEAPPQSQPPASPPSPPSSDPRKCWICFADETEDTPLSTPWRSPCPCALTAHESCLLDWVADLEAPASRKRTTMAPRIQCPQCKSDITIARPKSYIVEGVSAIERIAGRLVVPGIFVTLAGSLAMGCWIHGLGSVYVVFGREDFKRLMGVDSGRGIGAKWGFGLPFIPVVLVLARTSLADNLLPVLPILFFATQGADYGRRGLQGLWPPSAAMTFATLPYLRGAYNEVYKRMFAQRVVKWTKELQPRAGENGEGGVAEGNGGNEEEEREVNVGFELNLEVEIFEEGEHVHPPPPQPQQQQGDGAPVGQAGGAANREQDANPAPIAAPAPRQNGLVLSTSRLADTIIGALSFPAIAATMGMLMKVGLPKKYTTPATDRLRPGILQTQWGRSVVGGCLFVVMKDMAIFYTRYRLAQDHRKRRVVDYDRSRSKVHKR